MVKDAISIRPATPEDYDAIIAVMDEWWGRPVSSALPRLFLDHFHRTSLVALDEGRVAAFLVGFVSPDQPGEAYVHFLGVAPDVRAGGLGRALYERFFDNVVDVGVRRVRAITPVINTASQEFHRRMGFEVHGPFADHHGPGRDRIVFVKDLGTRERWRRTRQEVRSV